MLETILLALASVLFRSANSVFDRLSFGLRNQSITLINFLNNFVPFLLLLAGGAVLGKQEGLAAALGDVRLIFFALSVQAVGYAFSYGFRHLTVAQVNIASRVGDILIPFSILLCGGVVGWRDYLFAAALSGCSLVLGQGGGSSRKLLLVPGLWIALALIVQSLCGELFFQGQGAVGTDLGTVTALMFWRSMLCLLLLPLGFRTHPPASMLAVVLDARMQLHALFRALFTVAAQVTFMLALAGGHRVVVWPILNSSTLVSVGLAGLFLKERPARREMVTVAAIICLSLLKGSL
ncbi:hypothetical protein [Archangium lipolyticum]|uniref:hypothetical protein n=1 Tax=Archangium lipolyticum TaxID=2970465 RepID=UPI00214A0529|nr:hypothetical protein [Archangium lipolyticum]